MSTDEEKAHEDRIRSLELTLEEQRRDYDVLNGLFEQVKVKNITFLAAALGLLGYLYTGNPDGSLKNKLFIPSEPYGVIIYALSLLLFLAAIGMLLSALQPRTWSTAFDTEQEDCVTEDYEKYLKYMKRRYLRASKINCNSYAKRQFLLEKSFIPLVVGGILLLLLKTFGG